MTDSEYELATRRVTLRVYRFFLLGAIPALVLCPLAVWLAGKWFDSQAATFGIGLVVALVLIGLPLTLALNWADKEWSRLRYEQDEDRRAQFWKKYREHIHEEVVTYDQDDDTENQEEVRPD